MVGIIIWVIVIGFLEMGAVSIIDLIRRKNTKEPDHLSASYVSDFSPSAYMGRIEKTSVEIMKVADKAPKYQLVLWAGLDGLRLNEDGTSEWIQREKNPKPVSVSYSPTQSLSWSPVFNCNQIQNVSCETQNQLAMLQARTQNLQFQQWQTQQMQNMINAVPSLYGPTYIQAKQPYYQPTYYSAVNQCCARQ